jgi:hypothetical protein
MTRQLAWLALGLAWLAPLIAAAGPVSIAVKYRRAANTFQILDCLSNWDGRSCGSEGAYERHWVDWQGLTREDRAAIERYRAIRKKHYTDPYGTEPDLLKAPHGLFAAEGNLLSDPLAEAFYSSDEVDAALAKARRFLAEDELKFLGKFYAGFSGRLEGYLRESERFVAASSGLQNLVRKPGYLEFLGQARDFFNVKAEIDYQVLYVWWPPMRRDWATSAGNYLVISANPNLHLDQPNDDLVLHEIIHTLTASQDPGQKRALTRQFLAGCGVAGKLPGTGRILDEPLAVAIGQMMFLERFDPERYRKEKNWYRGPWVADFAQALFPLLKDAFARKRSIDQGFIAKASEACQRLGKDLPPAAPARKSGSG